MKIKELVKKGLVLGLLCLLASMFISCGDKGNSSGDTTYYTLKYKTYIIIPAEEEIITESDISEFTAAGFTTPGDYSISGTTITLTDEGLDKFLAVMSEEESEESGEDIEYVYIVVYNNELIMPLTADAYTTYGGLLEEDDDYTVDGKAIVLTQAGYEKMSVLFSSGD